MQGHSDPVYCSMWTANKTGTEMMTSSEDGAVKWWDIRNMEAPVTMIDISGLDPDQQVSSCMMEYEPNIPSRCHHTLLDLNVNNSSQIYDWLNAWNCALLFKKGKRWKGCCFE